MHSRQHTGSFLLAVFVLASAIGALAAPAKSPPPVVAPPPVRTCDIEITYAKATGTMNKGACDGLANIMKTTYTTPFTFKCDSFSKNIAVVSAHPTILQTNSTTRFYKELKEGTYSQMVFWKVGQGKCGDSIIMKSNCNNVTSVTLPSCLPNGTATKPIVPCDITVQMQRSAGGLTGTFCKVFGPTISRLYKKALEFKCDGASEDGYEMTVSARNSWMNQVMIDNFYSSVIKDGAIFDSLSYIYSLECNVDKLIFTSNCRPTLTMTACSGPIIAKKP